MGRSKVERRAARKAKTRAVRAEGKGPDGGSSRASEERPEDRRSEGLAEQQERLQMENWADKVVERECFYHLLYGNWREGNSNRSDESSDEN